MSCLTTLLARLAKVRRSGCGWSARCPAHEDRRNSLTVAEGDDGRTLIRCHAGCPPERIVAAVGLTLRDLAPSARLTRPHSERSSLECGNSFPLSLSDRGSSSPPSPAPNRELSSPPSSTDHNNPPPSFATSPTERADADTRQVSASTAADRPVFPTADAAQAHLELYPGQCSRMWPYHDARGREVGRILRWERPFGGGKDIRPLSLHADGWRLEGMPEPRPLYRLPEVVRAERVLVCEGEKAADAGRQLGLVCTTSSHGAASASKTDWSPLAGKKVYLLPDHDEPGRQYMADVARRLAALSPPPAIHLLELDELPQAGDLYDWVHRCRTLDPRTLQSLLHTRLEKAPRYSFPPPQAAVAPYEDFPAPALPDPLRSFVTEAAAVIGCDPCYLALPLLAGLASAIGNTRCVELKPGWCEPAILWTAVVGDSGTQKSPALEAALRPVRQKQADAFLEHAEQAARHETELAEYERSLTQWKRSRQQDEPPPTRPARPLPLRYWCADTTVEALAPLLVRQPRGLLLVRDELSGWLGGLDRYAGRRGGDAAAWLEMYGGRELLVDRKSDAGPLFVPRAAVSVTGGIQPATLRRSLGQEHLDNGLAARLLLAWPPRRDRAWSQQGLPEDLLRQIAHIFDGLYALELDYDDQGAPQPRRLTLSPAAEAAWAEFYNRHAAQQRELEGELAAAWSKLEGACARLALVIHLAQTVHAPGAWRPGGWRRSLSDAPAESPSGPEPSVARQEPAKNAAGAAPLSAPAGASPATPAPDTPADRITLTLRTSATAADPTQIDAASMHAAIRLTQFFAHEARRVYGMLQEPPEERDRRRLVDLIANHGGEITPRDLQRATRLARTADHAHRLLDDLVQAGYGVWATPQQPPTARHTPQLFRLLHHPT